MNKLTTILVSICGSLAVCSLVIYVFLSAVNKNLPQDLSYPKSGLSESIFDSQGQNMKYQADENLTAVHKFRCCPYTFDTLETDRADVGNYGAVYRVNDGTYIYTTEVMKGLSVESLIKKELSRAVMVDADTEISVVDNLVYDEGYCNGFKADYYIDRLTVSNKNRSASVYITGYLLTLTDPEAMHGYNIFMSIVTAQPTTEGFAQAKKMLDTLVQTMQYDEKIQEELLEYEEDEAKRLKEELMNDTSISTSGSSETDMGSQASAGRYDIDEYVPKQDAPQTDGIPRKKDKSINIDEEYDNVTLYYYYDNTEETLTLVLHDPYMEKEYAPESVQNGVAVFKLPKMEVGKWRLTIIGNPGTENVRLYTEAMEEAE